MYYYIIICVLYKKFSVSNNSFGYGLRSYIARFDSATRVESSSTFNFRIIGIRVNSVEKFLFQRHRVSKSAGSTFIRHIDTSVCSLTLNMQYCTYHLYLCTRIRRRTYDTWHRQKTIKKCYILIISNESQMIVGTSYKGWNDKSVTVFTIDVCIKLLSKLFYAYSSAS